MSNPTPKELRDFFNLFYSRVMYQSPSPEKSIYAKLKELPSVAGQLIDQTYLTWGHKLVATKTQQLTDGDQSWFMAIKPTIVKVGCSCGWTKELGVETSTRIVNYHEIDLITKVWLEHIKVPFEEVSYIEITLEWLEDLPKEMLNGLIQFMHSNNVILQHLLNTRSVLIIDDKMTEQAKDELARILEGHPFSTRVLKVYKEK